MKQVEIFTDGACKGNPGPGGWGTILRYNGREKELSVICRRRWALRSIALMKMRARMTVRTKERQKVVNRMGTCFWRAMSKALRKEKPLLKRAGAPKKAAVTEMKKEAVRKAEKVKVRKAKKTPAGRANMVLTMQMR